MDSATPMMKLFHKRSGMIARGHYHAKPPLYEALSGKARAKARKKFFKDAHKAASAQAKMDPADPFVYDRLMAQMKLGIIRPYEVPRNRRISI